MNINETLDNHNLNKVDNEEVLSYRKIMNLLSEINRDGKTVINNLKDVFNEEQITDIYVYLLNESFIQYLNKPSELKNIHFSITNLVNTLVDIENIKTYVRIIINNLIKSNLMTNDEKLKVFNQTVNIPYIYNKIIQENYLNTNGYFLIDLNSFDLVMNEEILFKLTFDNYNFNSSSYFNFIYVRYINNSNSRFYLIMKIIISHKEINSSLVNFLISNFKIKLINFLLLFNQVNYSNTLSLKIINTKENYIELENLLLFYINDIKDNKNTTLICILIDYLNNTSLIASEQIIKKLQTNQLDIVFFIIKLLSLNVNNSKESSNIDSYSSQNAKTIFDYLFTFNIFLLKNLKYFIKLVTFNHNLNLYYFILLFTYCTLKEVRSFGFEPKVTLSNLNTILVLLLSLYNSFLTEAHIVFNFLVIKVINYAIASIEDVKLKFNSKSIKSENMKLIDLEIIYNNHTKRNLIKNFNDNLDFNNIINKIKEEMKFKDVCFELIHYIYIDISEGISCNVDKVESNNFDKNNNNNLEKKAIKRTNIDNNIENKKNLSKNKTRYISIKYKNKYKNNINGSIPNSDSTEIKDHVKRNNNKRFITININKNHNESNNNYNQLSDHDYSDKYSDLNCVNYCSNLNDIILGLHSEDKKRRVISLLSIKNVISKKPYDIELQIEDLCLILIKLLNEENNYNLIELERNSNNKNKGNEVSENNENIVMNQNLILSNLLQILKEYYPAVTKVFCKRFFKLKKEKSNNLSAFRVDNLSNMSSNRSILNGEYNVVESDSSGVKEKYYIILIFNLMIKNTETVNSEIINSFIFPVLHYLAFNKLEFIVSSDINRYNLLSEFLLFISSALIKFKNSILIYKLLLESHILFSTVVNLKEVRVFQLNSNLNLFLSLIFYCNSFSEYLESKHIEVYPEIIDKSKENVGFLSKLFNSFNDNNQFFNSNSKLKNVDIKLECLTTLNSYTVKISKIKDERSLPLESIFKLDIK